MNKLNNGRLAKRAEDEEIAKDEAFIAAAFRFFRKTLSFQQQNKSAEPTKHQSETMLLIQKEF